VALDLAGHAREEVIVNTRLVVLVVGAALLCSVIGIVVLAATSHTTPDVLQNIAVGYLTGLVGLLVPAKEAGRKP
jgi:hypothetical protein